MLCRLLDFQRHRSVPYHICTTSFFMPRTENEIISRFIRTWKFALKYFRRRTLEFGGFVSNISFPNELQRPRKTITYSVKGNKFHVSEKSIFTLGNNKFIAEICHNFERARAVRKQCTITLKNRCLPVSCSLSSYPNVLSKLDLNVEDF